ncbi:MAG: hypothetical protein ACTSRB_11035 [Candidatus Helarchaeota archaeon]
MKHVHSRTSITIFVLFLSVILIFVFAISIFVTNIQVSSQFQLPKIIQITDEEEWKNISIYTVDMYGAGYYEIGESIRISTTYVLNVSSQYEVIRNSLDLENFYFDDHFLPHPRENFEISKVIFLDPESYDPVTQSDVRAVANIEIEIDPEGTGAIEGVTLKSVNGIRIFKADLAYQILDQYPSIIFQGNKTKISIQFYNEHNSTFKFRNQLINCQLFDPDFVLISNENVSTNSEGILNLTLDTDSGKSGMYRAILNNIETIDYNPLNLNLQFEVLDINNSFFVSILNASNIFPVVSYEHPQINIQVQTEFLSNVSYLFNSDFGFLDTSNHLNHQIVFQSLNESGIHDLILEAIPFEQGSNLTKIVPIQIKPRPLSCHVLVHKNPGSRIMDFSFFFKDAHSSREILDGECIELFFWENTEWKKVKEVYSMDGWANFSWSLPQTISNEVLLQYRINGKIYDDEFWDLELTPIEIIPQVTLLGHILKNKILKFSFQTKNGVFLGNEEVNVYLNGKYHSTLISNENGELIFSLLIPESLNPIHIKFVYFGNGTYLAEEYNYVILITNGFMEFLMSNMGLTISTLLIGCFSAILFKRKRLAKNLQKMKMK